MFRTACVKATHRQATAILKPIPPAIRRLSAARAQREAARTGRSSRCGSSCVPWRWVCWPPWRPGPWPSRSSRRSGRAVFGFWGPAGGVCFWGCSDVGTETFFLGGCLLKGGKKNKHRIPGVVILFVVGCLNASICLRLLVFEVILFSLFGFKGLPSLRTGPFFSRGFSNWKNGKPTRKNRLAFCWFYILRHPNILTTILKGLFLGV